MKTDATLYYYPEDDELVGRALTNEEYDNLSLFELQNAIGHSGVSLCLFDTDSGARPTAEFYNFSVEDIKQRLKQDGAIVMRLERPDHRNEFPPITRGPRKGMPNFKKEPAIYYDRWHFVEFEEDLVARKGVIDQADDGTFTVIENGSPPGKDFPQARTAYGNNLQ